MIANGVNMFPNSMVSSSPRVAELQERVSARSTLKRYMTMTVTHKCIYDLKHIDSDMITNFHFKINIIDYVTLKSSLCLQNHSTERYAIGNPEIQPMLCRTIQQNDTLLATMKSSLCCTEPFNRTIRYWQP